MSNTRRGVVLLPALLVSVAFLHAQSVTVKPATATVMTGGSLQFSKQTMGLTPETVTWAVQGIPSGDAMTVGSIDANGLYKAPFSIPAQNPVTITASSTAMGNIVGQASVTIVAGAPMLTSATPSPLVAGNFVVVLNGSGFAPGAVAYNNGVMLTTISVLPNSITATGYQAPAASTVFTARNPGTPLSNSLTVPLATQAPSNDTNPSITILPGMPSVKVGSTVQFSVSAKNLPSAGVTWGMGSAGQGNATVGTISPTGLYVPPSSPGTHTVKVTSRFSPPISQRPQSP